MTGLGRPVFDRPYLLCLGTDFAHKNRRFALALLEALVPAGGSTAGWCSPDRESAPGHQREEEATYLATRPQLAERVIDLGAVE